MFVVVLRKKLADKTYYYPQNAAACLFCEMLHQKTLTDEDLEFVRLLGFELSVLNS